MMEKHNVAIIHYCSCVQFYGSQTCLLIYTCSKPSYHTSTGFDSLQGSCCYWLDLKLWENERFVAFFVVTGPGITISLLHQVLVIRVGVLATKRINFCWVT